MKVLFVDDEVDILEQGKIFLEILEKFESIETCKGSFFFMLTKAKMRVL